MQSTEQGQANGMLPAYDRSSLPVAESSIGRAELRRLALIGTAIGLACLLACLALGLLIRATVFS